jgi:hypothetical protein
MIFLKIYFLVICYFSKNYNYESVFINISFKQLVLNIQVILFHFLQILKIFNMIMKVYI